VADVLLVNIWCHDIGREHGSGKPLMKTIFQVGRARQARRLKGRSPGVEGEGGGGRKREDG
jgi:hypothetical protein